MRCARGFFPAKFSPPFFSPAGDRRRPFSFFFNRAIYSRIPFFCSPSSFLFSFSKRKQIFFYGSSSPSSLLRGLSPFPQGVKSVFTVLDLPPPPTESGPFLLPFAPPSPFLPNGQSGKDPPALLLRIILGWTLQPDSPPFPPFPALNPSFRRSNGGGFPPIAPFSHINPPPPEHDLTSLSLFPFSLTPTYFSFLVSLEGALPHSFLALLLRQ